MRYEQNFLWKPKVKDRPRHGRSGKPYTPKATVDAEAALAAQYIGPKFEGPIAVEFDFYNDRIQMRIVDVDPYEHRKLTGDTDNYLKLCQDALNEVAYFDDRQIREITGRKN